MAVLNFMFSMSSPTFLMVLWMEASCSLEYSSPPGSLFSARFQTPVQKPLAALYGVGGPRRGLFKIADKHDVKSQRISAELSYYVVGVHHVASGLRHLLLLSFQLDPRIIPWLVRLAYGSFVGTTPMSYRNLCQNLE